MKSANYIFTNAVLCIAAFAVTANAQQVAAPIRQGERSAGESIPQRPAKAAQNNPAAKLPRKLTIDPPKRTDQQLRMARRVEQAYLANFQSRVGLSDEQSVKLGPTLADYIQRKQRLADLKIEIQKQLTEKTNQHAPSNEIQDYVDAHGVILNQQANIERKFYADMDSQLSVEQRARLRQYMSLMEQRIQNLIQQSTQPQQSTPPQ